MFLFKKRGWTKHEILGRSSAEIHPEPQNGNDIGIVGYGSTGTMSSNPNNRHEPRIESAVDWASVVSRYRILTGTGTGIETGSENKAHQQQSHSTDKWMTDTNTNTNNTTAEATGSGNGNGNQNRSKGSKFNITNG